MKIHLPSSFFQPNKLKEIYYKSLVVKNTEEKFDPLCHRAFPLLFETEKEIMMMNIKWGASRKTVTRLLGNPRFACKALADDRSDILFFKQEIQQEKAIIQCHFLKDQFYYAHIDFVSSLSTENLKIQEMVRHKFQIADLKADRNLIITDPAENKLILEHNVYLHLEYLTGKPSIVKKIKEQAFLKSETKRPPGMLKRPSIYL